MCEVIADKQVITAVPFTPFSTKLDFYLFYLPTAVPLEDSK